MNRRRIESIVGWLSLIISIIGVIEKFRHYIELGRKAHRHRGTTFGFHSASPKRKHPS